MMKLYSICQRLLSNHLQEGYKKTSSFMLAVVITVLSFCLTPSAFAWDNKTCDPSQDFCIIIIPDSSLPVEIPITSNLSYDVEGTHVQLTDNTAWIYPNNTVTVTNLPVDLLTRIKIQNFQLKITQVSGYPVANCSTSTPIGRLIKPGFLKLRVLYNPETTSFSCTPV